jgi:hypothetical protein
MQSECVECDIDISGETNSAVDGSPTEGRGKRKWANIVTWRLKFGVLESRKIAEASIAR